jgi:RNA polymerase subunit RPABC4/transcription elongation factor Spt4
MAKAKINHVMNKDGTAWCGTKTTTGAPFDAPACKKCSKIVREKFGGSAGKESEEREVCEECLEYLDDEEQGCDACNGSAPQTSAAT